MPQWFLPYTAAALVAAALGWLALEYDPDADRQTPAPVLAGAPAPGQPGAQQAPAPAGGNASVPTPPAAQAPAASSGEAAVRAVVTEAMTTDRASDCTRLYTQAFLQQMSGKVGSAAVADCRENSDGEADSEQISFRRVDPAGGDYRVAISMVGGDMAGSTAGLIVTRSEGPWKIDQLLDIDVDISELAAAAADKAEEEGATPAEASCFEEKVAATSETAYERAVIEGRGNAYGEQIGLSAVDCLSAETLRKQIAEGIRRGAGDAPEALIECVIDRIVAGKSAAELRAMLQMGNGYGYELGRQAGIECAQMMGAAS